MTTYEVNVTPILRDRQDARRGITFEFSVYRSVAGGICGPFSETVAAPSLAVVDAELGRMGFHRTTEFGPVCSNGFATATVEPVR